MPDALRLDLIIRQSPIGMAMVDHDGFFLMVNSAYCQILGFREDELVGRPFWVVFPPAEREWMLETHRAFLEDGLALSREWDLIRRDRSSVSVLEHWTSCPGDAGAAQCLVSVVDISERRQRESAARSSELFVQAALDGLSSHVCVLDQRGTLIAVNRAWRNFSASNGGSVDSAYVGINYLDVCDQASRAKTHPAPEAAQMGAQLKDVLLGTRQEFRLEYPCHSPSKRRWFVTRVSRMTGSTPGCVVVAHDNVTELRRTA